MAVSVADVREIIDEFIALLKNQGAETEYQGQLSKLESVRGVLIRNEKKIWLRTRKGREMLAEIGAASESLRDSLRSSDEMGAIDAAINTLETHSRAIDEESRKRSMVVT